MENVKLQYTEESFRQHRLLFNRNSVSELYLYSSKRWYFQNVFESLTKVRLVNSIRTIDIVRIDKLRMASACDSMGSLALIGSAIPLYRRMQRAN
jgi:hypothetical protein